MVSIKNLEDLESINLKEDEENIEKKLLIGEKDGATNFEMKLFTIGPNGYSEHHTHDWDHEIFILNGEGILKSKNKDYNISQGDCIYIKPKEEHQIQNPYDKDLKYILANSLVDGD